LWDYERLHLDELGRHSPKSFGIFWYVVRGKVEARAKDEFDASTTKFDGIDWK
jgi:hypothetical protein